MSFNFQIAEYTALVGVPNDPVPARVTLTEELVGVWLLSAFHRGIAVACFRFRSDDPLKDASKKLATLGYSG